MDEQDGGAPTWGGGNNGSDEDWPQSGVGSVATQVPRKESAPRRALASIGFVLDATRRRRSGRLFLWFLVIAMALGGLWLLLYPVATDIWANRIQNRLEDQFTQVPAPDPSGVEGIESQRPAVGQPLTRIRIPKLGVNVIVVEGISGNALRAGAGHYPTSPLPCEPGNVAIAGHRTGFGEPFRHLERLSEGDLIVLETPFESCRYRVTGPVAPNKSNPWITHARDWTVVSPTPDSVLTLTTCDPPGTSKNRLIVRAALVRGTG
ncbi:MAG TPA: class E sortase [Actinomycetota bacterium]|jgi:sortase A